MGLKQKNPYETFVHTTRHFRLEKTTKTRPPLHRNGAETRPYSRPEPPIVAGNDRYPSPFTDTE